MLDKLVDFLINFITLFKFFYVVKDWEMGVNLRFGVWTKKILKPGLHYIFPFFIDEVLVISVVPAIAELEPQTVITKDKVVTVVQAVVNYEVKEPETCLLKVDNEIDAVKELTQGAIHTVLVDVDYATADIKEIEREIRDLAKRRVAKWGINVVSVTIKSFGKMTSIRLLQ